MFFFKQAIHCGSKYQQQTFLRVHHSHFVAHTPRSLQMLYQEGGIGRFYRGFTPCIVRAMPANGVMLLTVEKVTGLLNSMSS